MPYFIPPIFVKFFLHTRYHAMHYEESANQTPTSWPVGHRPSCRQDLGVTNTFPLQGYLGRHPQWETYPLLTSLLSPSFHTVHRHTCTSKVLVPSLNPWKERSGDVPYVPCSSPFPRSQHVPDGLNSVGSQLDLPVQPARLTEELQELCPHHHQSSVSLLCFNHPAHLSFINRRLSRSFYNSSYIHRVARRTPVFRTGPAVATPPGLAPSWTLAESPSS